MSHDSIVAAGFPPRRIAEVIACVRVPFIIKKYAT